MPNKIKVCINKKYQRLINKYCINELVERGFLIEKFYANGATEEFFSNNLVDLVVDIVCTGESAQKAGLEVYQKIFSSDIVLIGNQDSDSQRKFDLQALYKKIQDKINSQDEKSYTKKLVADRELLKRKLIEEAAEVITAKNRDELIGECADLIYFLFVIMANESITIKDIEKENERRDKETFLNSKELNKSSKERKK